MASRQIRTGDIVRLNLEHLFREDLPCLSRSDDFPLVRDLFGLVLFRNEFAMAAVFWLNDAVRTALFDDHYWMGVSGETVGRFVYRCGRNSSRTANCSMMDIADLRIFP